MTAQGVGEPYTDEDNDTGNCTDCLSVSGPVLSSPQPCGEGFLMIPILQMGKLRLREMM